MCGAFIKNPCMSAVPFQPLFLMRRQYRPRDRGRIRVGDFLITHARRHVPDRATRDKRGSPNSQQKDDCSGAATLGSREKPFEHIPHSHSSSSSYHSSKPAAADLFHDLHLYNYITDPVSSSGICNASQVLWTDNYRCASVEKMIPHMSIADQSKSWHVRVSAPSLPPVPFHSLFSVRFLLMKGDTCGRGRAMLNAGLTGGIAWGNQRWRGCSRRRVPTSLTSTPSLTRCKLRRVPPGGRS